MAPKQPNLKLDKDALQGGGAADGKKGGRPETLRLVIGGTAGIPAINDLTLKYKDNGFGKDKQAPKLGGICYELNPGEKADASLDQFKVAFQSPGNIPVTLLHPLTGKVDENSLPAPDTPPQFAQVCFSLPYIRKASDIQGDNEEKWLKLFEKASERQLTLELALAPSEEVREAIEKFLGKVWDQEQAIGKKLGYEDDINNKGLRILIDALASPPLGQSSSQLVRSKDQEAWSDFVSRLALNPHVYLKLSPLPLPSSLPVALGQHTRPVDTGYTGQIARSAQDLAAQAVAAAETKTSGSPEERQQELQARLRVFLETALEAFGEERIAWTSYLSAGHSLNAGTGEGGNGDIASLSEPEQWFEVVLAALQNIGVSQTAIDNIFSHNVSKVFRM